MLYNKEINSLRTFAFHLFKENSSGNGADMLSDTADKIVLHAKLVASGFVFGMAVYAVYPLYDFTFNGAYTQVSAVLLPYVDEETLSGYLFITGYTVFISGYAVLGGLVFSFAFVMVTDVYAGLVSLVQDDFRKLDTMREKNENIDVQFKNTLLKLMDAVKYEFFNWYRLNN